MRHCGERDIRTYIFSNTNHLAIENVRKLYPFFRDFDDYIFSYEHGAMKPDSKLYEVVEERSGCRGAARGVYGRPARKRGCRRGSRLARHPARGTRQNPWRT